MATPDNVSEALRQAMIEFHKITKSPEIANGNLHNQQEELRNALNGEPECKCLEEKINQVMNCIVENAGVVASAGLPVKTPLDS